MSVLPPSSFLSGRDLNAGEQLRFSPGGWDVGSEGERFVRLTGGATEKELNSDSAGTGHELNMKMDVVAESGRV